MSAEDWINKLGLETHPEGGYYKEVYRNPATIQLSGGGGTRNLATSIYFLLKGGQKSHFHQLKSDEQWYFHHGTPVEIHIFERGNYRQEVLGLDLDKGQKPQILIPANSIFAAEVSSGVGYSLMGCMVNPGFDFKDFRMLSAEELTELYPDRKPLIKKFTVE